MDGVKDQKDPLLCIIYNETRCRVRREFKSSPNLNDSVLNVCGCGMSEAKESDRENVFGETKMKGESEVEFGCMSGRNGRCPQD